MRAPYGPAGIIPRRRTTNTTISVLAPSSKAGCFLNIYAITLKRLMALQLYAMLRDDGPLLFEGEITPKQEQ
jgi:hypothetical protein